MFRNAEKLQRALAKMPAAAMAKQPEIVAAFRARQKTKAKGLEKVWDDFVLTKRERTLKIRLQDMAGGGK